MQLKYLYISRFKNLKNFEINFDDKSYVDLIIGQNGTGKSNIFEAIIEIFKFLNDTETIIEFEFKIYYSINEEDIEIEYTKNKIFKNKEQIKKLTSAFFPDNILVYYSGHNDRITRLIEKYEDKYLSQIKKDEPKEIRFLFGLGNKHKNILLLIACLLRGEYVVNQKLIKNLNISKINSDIKLTLCQPHYFKNRKLSSWDESSSFWGIKGYLKDFLNELYKNKTISNRPRKEGYFEDSSVFVFYVDLDEIKQIITRITPLKFFQFFDDLRAIGMFESVDFSLNLCSGDVIGLNEFSDGEYQSIFFSCIVELFKDKNCLTLLDEPDAFLHPEWQFQLVKNIIDLPKTNFKNNHIMINSHCASTILSSGDEKISLIDVIDNKAKCISVSKEYAVRKLSSGIIVFNEEEQILSILNKIKIESKPILFTEGHTDPIIIKHAWSKLRKTPIPFIPIYSFNCEYLRRIIQDEKIYKEAGGNPLFGLFDFDEAYNDWNGINGEVIEKNPDLGMCKKIENKKGYVFLLPVPPNQKIREQVIKSEKTKQTFLHESRLTVELLFYGHKQTEKFFDSENCPGGSKVVFNWDKDKFAKEIIPNLPEESFKIFEPIFTFIESKIKK